MARILGIDFGTKRIGIAISDEEERIAFPKDVLDGTDPKIIARIADICTREHVECIVLGIPQGLSGQRTDMTEHVYAFKEKLGHIGLPIVLQQEFFSSQEVERGPTTKDHRDAAAAALILQSYLERRKRMIQ